MLLRDFRQKSRIDTGSLRHENFCRPLPPVNHGRGGRQTGNLWLAPLEGAALPVKLGELFAGEATGGKSESQRDERASREWRKVERLNTT